jgi:hypothetical protein
MSASTELYILTRAGVLHRGLATEGRRLVDEQCNLDDSNIARVSDSPIEPKKTCRRCFPGEGD